VLAAGGQFEHNCISVGVFYFVFMSVQSADLHPYHVPFTTRTRCHEVHIVLATAAEATVWTGLQQTANHADGLQILLCV
jgi:hypothetical protein